MNEQKNLEALLKELEGHERVHRLFLHSCCAPCSSYVLEYLTPYFEITSFFYNPNITQKEEFEKRSAELQRLIREMPKEHEISFMEGDFVPASFFERTRGLEKCPEGGERCFKCYEMRLYETARLASEKGYDYFATTLTISPLKKADKINEIGRRLEKDLGVKWLPSDFKKKNGYLRSIQLSKKYGLYRQNFCGCVFSKAEADQRDAETGSKQL